MSTQKTSSQSNNVSISIFQGRFILQKLLGKGGFGEVYSGIHTHTNEPVAVKMERRTEANSFLFHEARVMQDIQKQRWEGGLPSIATLKYFGQEGDFRMLIMTLQGPSIEDIHEKRQRFGLKTTVMLADQMISRLEYVHRAGYIHRDLKPDNFLIGREHPRRIFLIDFGLSCRYKTPEGRLREMQSGKSFVGTSRYASLRTHQGFSQSRRDDIEQLVYVILYMYRGQLPWSGLAIKNRDEKERRIGELKGSLTPTEICANCPRQFADLLYYARNMAFSETPEYDMCRVLLKSVLESMSPPEAMDYEWEWLSGSRKTSGVASQAQGGNPNNNNNNMTMQQQSPVLGSQQQQQQQISPSSLPAPLHAPPQQIQLVAGSGGGSGLHAGLGGTGCGAMGHPQLTSTPPLHAQPSPIQLPQGMRAINSPPTSPGGPEAALVSNAKAQGFFSGFGSNALSQDIMSLGDKN